MNENYVNAIETFELYVYDSGQRVSADATPTATAIDLETDDPVSLTSVNTVNHTDGYNYYQVQLSAGEVTTTRQVALTWEFTYNGSTYNRTELIYVVRPYFDADDFWSAYPEFALDGVEPKSVDEVQDVERKVRMRINHYCGQSFQDYGELTKRVRGNGTNALQLPERIYYLESVKSGELVLFERDGTGAVTTDTAIWYKDEPFLITKKGTESPHITFSDKDPVVSTVERTRSLFRSDRLYEVTGKFGWEYLPQEVQQAAVILGYELLQAEDRYRQKNVSVLRSADYRMEFGADHHTTTGNVDVDMLLDGFVNEGVYVF